MSSTGASGVDVNGVLYDVAFVDGSCVSVFDGCDDISEFDFITEADAVAASSALLNLVDAAPSIDADSSGVLGCSSEFNCNILTPFGFVDINGSAQYTFGAAQNFSTGFGISDRAIVSRFPLSTSGTNTTFARWTPVAPVPLPESATFLVLGIAGMAAFKSRKIKAG